MLPSLIVFYWELALFSACAKCWRRPSSDSTFMLQGRDSSPWFVNPLNKFVFILLELKEHTPKWIGSFSCWKKIFRKTILMIEYFYKTKPSQKLSVAHKWEVSKLYDFVLARMALRLFGNAGYFTMIQIHMTPRIVVVKITAIGASAFPVDWSKVNSRAKDVCKRRTVYAKPRVRLWVERSNYKLDL